MVSFFVFFLSFIMVRTELNKVFEGSLSFYPPYVSDNGSNRFFELEGDHLVMCNFENFDYIQLGYEDKNTSGLIKTKDPIKKTNFLIEIEFHYKPTQQAGGAGFWLADDFVTGNFYGMKKEYRHLGVVLDAKKGMAATFINGLEENNTKNQVTMLSKYRERSKISFQVFNNNLNVSMVSAGKKYELFDGHVTDLHKMRFGITVDTGESDSGDLVIYKIMGYKIKNVKSVYVKGETKKSKKLVYFLGIICICGLGYYRVKSIKTKMLA